jgi:hypothetical protein
MPTLQTCKAMRTFYVGGATVIRAMCAGKTVAADMDE